MRVIHFTHGAADPLESSGAEGAHFLPLADGNGDTHVSCVHLRSGTTISAPSLTHAATLLIVHGRITITSEYSEPCTHDLRPPQPATLPRRSTSHLRPSPRRTTGRPKRNPLDVVHLSADQRSRHQPHGPKVRDSKHQRSESLSKSSIARFQTPRMYATGQWRYRPLHRRHLRLPRPPKIPLLHDFICEGLRS
jgi:hypothetical protein